MRAGEPRRARGWWLALGLIAVGAFATARWLERRAAPAPRSDGDRHVVAPRPDPSVARAEGAEPLWLSVPDRDGQHAYQTNGYLFSGEGHLDLRAREDAPTPDRIELWVTAVPDDYDPRPLHNGARLERPLPAHGGGRVHVRVTLDGQLVGERELSRFFSEERVALELPASGAVRVEVRPEAGARALVYRVLTFTARPRPTRVVLISLDTHGARHMSLTHAQEIDTSPTLRRLLESDDGAIAFSGAMASADWTLPAHATVFTGVYPSQHGMTDRSPSRVAFDPELAILAELLHAGGASTAHLVSHTRVGSSYGYHRGVDWYRMYDEPLGQRGRALLADAVALIDQGRGHDQFVFVHLFDAHSPYTNYPPDYTALVGATAPEWPGDLYAGELYLGEIVGGGGWHPRKRAENLARYGEIFAPHMPGARAAYQLGIRDVDDMLGEFFDELRARKLFEDTTFLVVADHGEEFFEHGMLTHSSLYQDNLNVPFLLRLAAGAPQRAPLRGRDKVVPYRFEAHTSVFRVVLDLFSVPAPDYLASARTHGLGLAELLALDADHPVFSELHRAPTDDYYEASLIDPAGRQTLFSTRLGAGNAWRMEDEFLQVFDLEADPGNRRDRAQYATDANELRAAVLRKALEVRELTFESTYEGALSAEERERLRALGYL